MGVTALTPPQEDFARLHDELLSAGVRCLLPLHAAGLPGRLWGLFRSVRTFRPDVIFAHATIPAFYVRSLPITVPSCTLCTQQPMTLSAGCFEPSNAP